MLDPNLSQVDLVGPVEGIAYPLQNTGLSSMGRFSETVPSALTT